MKPKTFVILSPGFPKDEADSTCLPFLQQFVEQLNGQFPMLQIIVLAFDYPFVNETYTWEKNEVISFNGWKKRRISKLFKWRSILTTLKKINRNHAIVGMLSLWCGECAYLGRLFSERNQVPHFCWILGQDAKPGNKYIRSMRPSSPGLIAISDFIQKEFEKNYPLKPELIIPVGIQADLFKGVIRTRDIDILGVGSLIALKQYTVLIEIVRDIRPLFPQIQVRLCGKGPEMAALKNLIADYGLEKNIMLTGVQSHEEILNLMSRTKLFLHPSLYEGMAAVCLEALASGCHVISFVRSMQQDIRQWYIVSSKEQMAEKTISLLYDHRLLFQPTIPFTVRQSVEKIMQLYQYNDPAIS